MERIRVKKEEGYFEFIVLIKTDEEMEVELFSTELRAKKALKSMEVEV